MFSGIRLVGVVGLDSCVQRHCQVIILGKIVSCASVNKWYNSLLVILCGWEGKMLSSNNSRQVVHTHASVTKQYNLVVARSGHSLWLRR